MKLYIFQKSIVKDYTFYLGQIKYDTKKNTEGV